MTDAVNHPQHYTGHPSGVECIQIVEHMGFNLGNAIKYVWRADLKGKAVEDLRKALFYIEREIALRTPIAEHLDPEAPAINPAFFAPSTEEPNPVGCLVTVTGDTAGFGHQFEPGTVVRILDMMPQWGLVDGHRCESLDGSDWWWVAAIDLA